MLCVSKSDFSVRLKPTSVERESAEFYTVGVFMPGQSQLTINNAEVPNESLGSTNTVTLSLLLTHCISVRSC